MPLYKRLVIKPCRKQWQIVYNLVKLIFIGKSPVISVSRKIGRSYLGRRAKSRNALRYGYGIKSKQKNIPKNSDATNAVYYIHSYTQPK